jgi:hypothetical protein
MEDRTDKHESEEKRDSNSEADGVAGRSTAEQAKEREREMEESGEENAG